MDLLKHFSEGRRDELCHTCGMTDGQKKSVESVNIYMCSGVQPLAISVFFFTEIPRKEAISSKRQEQN